MPQRESRNMGEGAYRIAAHPPQRSTANVRGIPLRRARLVESIAVNYPELKRPVIRTARASSHHAGPEAQDEWRGTLGLSGSR